MDRRLISRRTCSVVGCVRVHHSMGYCRPHRERADKHGDPLVDGRKRSRPKKSCSFEGCKDSTHSRGLCSTHYAKARRENSFEFLNTKRCTVRDCSEAHHSAGMCAKHFERWKRLGSTFLPERQRTKARWLNAEGYVVICRPGHPNCFDKARGYIFEHRAVMADSIGRPLLSEETVHHKNGNRQDNSPANLELWSSNHGRGQRVEDQIEWAISILRRYAPDRLITSYVEARGARQTQVGVGGHSN